MWGSNARAAHPIFFHHVLRGMENGMGLIVVDPRRTESAAFADLWLGIDVGTDIALSNTIAREIIASDLHDRTFIERATENFEEYAESVADWTLERGAAVTGIPADVIREVAHRYATADRAMICWTLGITEHHNAVDNVLALINLGLLTGHVGRYGSGLNPLRGQNNVQGGGDMGAIPNKLPGFQDIVRDHEARAKFDAAWDTEIMPRYGWHLTEMFHAMESGELTAIYCIGENPVSSEADSQHARKLLENLDTLIVQDIFMTKTAEIADVVFPAANSSFESEGTVTNSERRVQRVRKALEPPGDAKDDIWIIAKLAGRLGSDWGDLTPHEAWDELRSLSPMHQGMSWERLDAMGGAQWPCWDEDHPGTQYLHARLWSENPDERLRAGAVQRRHRRSAGGRTDGAVPDPAHDRSSARLLQHRGPDRKLLVPAAASRGDRALARGRGSARFDRRRAGARVVSPRGGRRARARHERPATGARVHDHALPRRGRDEPADDRGDRPEIRDGRVQGDRDPRGEAERAGLGGSLLAWISTS